MSDRNHYLNPRNAEHITFVMPMNEGNKPNKTNTTAKIAFAGAVLLAGVYQIGQSQPEGSRLNDISTQIQGYAEAIYGQFTDPPAEDNPACLILEPVEIEGLTIPSSIMPRPCGEILIMNNGSESGQEEDLHLGIFIENHIQEEGFETLYDQNPSATREITPQLLELNEVEGTISQLNSSGLCASAISKILEGIEDTRHSSDPLGLNGNRNPTVKLYKKSENNEWVALDMECR